jgi:hypothetical protein
MLTTLILIAQLTLAEAIGASYYSTGATASLTLIEESSTPVPETTLPESMLITPGPDGQLTLPTPFPPDPVFIAKAQAAEHLKAALEGIPHFWYVAFGHKEHGLNDHSIVVMVDKVTPEIMDRVPKTYEGFDVKIRVYKGGATGPFAPLDTFPDRAKPVYIDPK